MLLSGCIAAPPGSSPPTTDTSGEDLSAPDAAVDAAEMPTDGGQPSPDAASDLSGRDTGADLAEDAGSPRYRIPITVPSGTVSETLVDFPLLLDLEHDHLAEVQPQPDDIAFVDANGDNLPRDIEAYQRSAGRLRVWVLAPPLQPDADTTIYLITEDRQNNTVHVWDDYAAVWHLQRADRMDAFSDRSPHRNHAFGVGGAETANGKIGDAVLFDGDRYLEVGDDDSLEPQQFTISLWANLTIPGDDVATLISKPYGEAFWDSYQIFVSAESIVNTWIVRDETEFYDGMHAIAPDTWVHIAYTYDGTMMTQYVDGAAHQVQVEGSAVSYDDHDLLIGADVDDGGIIGRFTGQLDEVRIATEPFSAARIQAERQNQDDPGAFYSVDDAQPY
jgi:hypothetical protein